MKTFHTAADLLGEGAYHGANLSGQHHIHFHGIIAAYDYIFDLCRKPFCLWPRQGFLHRAQPLILLVLPVEQPADHAQHGIGQICIVQVRPYGRALGLGNSSRHAHNGRSGLDWPNHYEARADFFGQSAGGSEGIFICYRDDLINQVKPQDIRDKISKPHIG